MATASDSPPELTYSKLDTPESSQIEDDSFERSADPVVVENSTRASNGDEDLFILTGKSDGVDAMASMTIDDDSSISERMRVEEERMAAAREKEDKKYDEKLRAEMKKDIGDKSVMERKYQRLEALLNKSKVYSSLILAQLEKEEEEAETAAEPEPAEGHRRGRGRPKKNLTQSKISTFFNKKEVEAKAAVSDSEQSSDKVEAEEGIHNLKTAKQPELVTGGVLRQYQLEGLAWLKSLYENGLNGILADEMGLGKTIQTIALLAFLREMGTLGPFLIVAPLSTTSNWVDEFQRWTPTIPVLLYHGNKQERADLQRSRLSKPGSKTFPVIITSYEICMNDRHFFSGISWKFVIIDEGHRIKNMHCRLVRDLQSFESANRLLITGTPLQNNLSELWSLLHFLMPEIFDDYQMFESWFNFSGIKNKSSFQKIFSAEREAQIVTKLHGILKPFLLRRVKADVEKSLPKKREYVLFAPMTQLQKALYQALLDGNAREYLEEKQYELLLANEPPKPKTGMKRKSGANSEANTPNKSARTSGYATPSSTTRSGRHTKKKLQTLGDISDRQFFAQLNAKTAEPEEQAEGSFEDATREFARRQIAMKKMGNPMMQLRLCCNSPYNFYDPFIRADGSEIDMDESLISSSGKMLLLDALLPVLFEKGHKVLLFSQFKGQLDIIQAYATALRGWNVCRIDGGVSQADRAAQIKAFNTSSSTSSSKKMGHKNAGNEEPANLFLLSTRAGGQGINLASADTVILFDSDWNPQMDLQAQDRAHRIGQTRNVIVYRFATRNTVEQLLLEAAEGKRRLEKLVIQKGGVHVTDRGSFKSTPARKLRGRTDTQRSDSGYDKDLLHEIAAGGDISDDYLSELKRLLEQTEGEEFDVNSKSNKVVLTGKDLKILMDRSDEAYIRAEKGLDAKGSVFKTVETGNMKGSKLLEGLDK